MFKPGDYVIYGNNGVCKVDEVRTLDDTGFVDDRFYYVMTLVYSKDHRVLTPVDNKKVLLRAVLTPKEAQEILQEAHQMEAYVIDDEKRRDIAFKNTLKSGDCKSMIQMIRILLQRKAVRIAEGKKVPSSDEQYLKLAREFVSREFAIAMNMEPEQAAHLIEKQIQ